MMTITNETENFVDALKKLLVVDNDAINEYTAAINRVHDQKIKSKFKNFRLDHKKHVEKISSVLKTYNMVIPETSGSKYWLTEVKNEISDTFRKYSILLAMLTNVEDIHLAYACVAKRQDLPSKIKAILKNGLYDEQKHKNWFEFIIKRYKDIF